MGRSLAEVKTRIVAGRELREGGKYTLIFYEREEGRGTIRVEKKMKLLKLNEHHATFQSKMGFIETYRYWDVEKLLKGEPR